MSRDSSLIDKITQQVREGLEERFSSYTELGHSLEGIGQPEDDPSACSPRSPHRPLG